MIEQTDGEAALQVMKEICGQNNLNIREKLDQVISKFRAYIIEVYTIPEDRRTDDSVIAFLEEHEEGKEIAEKVAEIMEKAELLRFSGKEIRSDEFELLYGMAEACVEQCERENRRTASGDS